MFKTLEGTDDSERADRHEGTIAWLQPGQGQFEINGMDITNDLAGPVQMDVPTNADNSGGPLVDACGRVVGVARWKSARDNCGCATDGLAFFIAERSLRTALERIRTSCAAVPKAEGTLTSLGTSAIGVRRADHVQFDR